MLETDEAIAAVLYGLRTAKKNARRRGLNFALPENAAEILVRRSGRRCEVTGTAFSMEYLGTSRKRPFAPSIDRINSTRGYELSNCRLVCCWVNLAMQDWGIAPLERWLAGSGAKALPTPAPAAASMALLSLKKFADDVAMAAALLRGQQNRFMDQSRRRGIWRHDKEALEATANSYRNSADQMRALSKIMKTIDGYGLAAPSIASEAMCSSPPPRSSG